MKIPRLLAISDPGATPGPAWRRWCTALTDAGVDGLQVRSKGCSDRDLLDLVTSARTPTSPGLTLIVNSRFDLALAAGAEGVQLPAEGLPVARIRSVLGPPNRSPLLVGRSTHSPDEVLRARDQGADFALFGPVFETPSKAGKIPARGLAGLAQAVRSGLPVLALGGIDADNAGQALDSGAWGLAAIRWFANPAAAREGLATVLRSWQEP